MLDTWFSSALWPFATLGWPDDTPELRAFYPTSFLTTAREILFLWVARMIMTGLEFAGDVPFRDVYVHSVIQARDGRRMSKSLGTGIDPLEEIDVHGADALRFGLLAMSSTQDVRFSDAKVQQGRDLANKLWNASRLILLNAAEVEPAPRPRHVEDRWILSRLERTIASVTEKLETYDFAHAAQEAYSFFWSRALRLVPGDRQAAPLRRRGGGLGDAALGAGAGAGAAAPDDAVRHRGDLVLPPGPRRPPRRAPVPESPTSRCFDAGRRGRRRGRDRADPAPARLARPGRACRSARALPARDRRRRAAGVRRPPRALRVRRRRRRAGRLDRPGPGPRLRASSTPRRSPARLEKRREELRGRGRARRAQARQRGLRRQGARPRWSRRSAASSSATAPSSSELRRVDAATRGLPRLAGADRLEARPRADAQADARRWACRSTASPRSTWSAPTASPR